MNISIFDVESMLKPHRSLCGLFYVCVVKQIFYTLKLGSAQHEVR